MPKHMLIKTRGTFSRSPFVRLSSVVSMTLLVLVLAVSAGELHSQSVMNTVLHPHQQYARMVQVSGQTSLRPSFLILPLIEIESMEAGPWASVSPSLVLNRAGVAAERWWSLQGSFSYRTGYPSDRNDGSLWQGKGLTTAIDFGAGVSWGRIRVTVHPRVSWTENKEFRLWPVFFEGQPEEAYPFRWIDLPQRLSDGSFWSVEPGESEVSVRMGGWAAGLSSRSHSWGPGRQNSIVLGSSAGGFPHAFISTVSPLNTFLGDVEAQWIFGRLSRSEMFLPDLADPGRYTTGLVVVWSPGRVQGLHLGAALMKYGSWSDQKWTMFSDILRAGSGDRSDQLGSMFFRWVLPRSGFELYAELARNDRWAGISDLLLEPEHGQGYTLGLQKTFNGTSDRTFVFSAELTHLEAEGTSRLRDNPTFYAHSHVLEGYTHRGQLLGARAGPGGVQQHLGLTSYSSGGLISFWLERRVKDNDAFYFWAERVSEQICTFCNHDVSFEAGAEIMRFFRGREVSLFADLTRQRNRWFEGPDVWNLGFGMRVRALGGF